MSPVSTLLADITTLPVGVIVNAAKPDLSGGGGVDGAIHAAAGPGLLEECKAIGHCATGSVVATAGYNLRARWVLHTVGPVYKSTRFGNAHWLADCYTNAIDMARMLGAKSIAFPAISTGIYGFPKMMAAGIAHTATMDIPDITIYLVAFDQETFDLYRELGIK